MVHLPLIQKGETIKTERPPKEGFGRDVWRDLRGALTVDHWQAISQGPCGLGPVQPIYLFPQRVMSFLEQCVCS